MLKSYWLRLGVLSLGVVIAGGSAVAQETKQVAPDHSKADFRGSRWGDAKALVKGRESKPLHHDMPDELAYWNFRMLEIDSGLVYRFKDDRLTHAYFLSRHRTADPKEDYADYRTFQKSNDEHFSATHVESWVWADAAAHDPSEQTVAAIAAGKVKLVSKWDLGKNQIRLELVGADGEMQTLRNYFEPKPVADAAADN